MKAEGILQMKGGDSMVLGLSHKRSNSSSSPEGKKVEEKGSSRRFEESQRIKLDMSQGKDSFRTPKKKLSLCTEVQSSLKHEILQLEKRLQGQFEVRRALEKALGHGTSSQSVKDDTPVPKPATELIKEIALLEMEVVHLEQYLLSLYRKAFDQQISSVSPKSKEGRLRSPLATPREENTLRHDKTLIQPRCLSFDHRLRDSSCIEEEGKLLDSSVQRCHSSLCHLSASTNKGTTSHEESLARALNACHSQPLSSVEDGLNMISLAEHLGTHISDHVLDTPNKISEEMVKCMSAIYCRLSDPPIVNHNLLSPSSSLSSTSGFSPNDQYDLWSPGGRNNSAFDIRLDNPFNIEGLGDFSGPYSTMVEVPHIHRDGRKHSNVDSLLQNFRSLVNRLKETDPRRLKHEEKLAFWINVHNALVMHTYLAYGIPQNNVKRSFLLSKPAYNVGGHTLSADAIQSSILRCKTSNPGQWLRFFLSPKKFKVGDERQAYSIEYPEPLLFFALCSGSHSDPAVRVYTPKRIHQELETAKEEYIRATLGIRKDQKILLPRMIESFAKEISLSQSGLIEMVQSCLPESSRKSIKRCQRGKSRKIIEWVQHDHRFRYLISKELVR